MHVPLDEHLHTEECNIIIRDLKEVTMQACTRKERLARTAKNRENTNKRQADRKKTVKLETCFGYLDTRDDYSEVLWWWWSLSFSEQWHWLTSYWGPPALCPTQEASHEERFTLVLGIERKPSFVNESFIDLKKQLELRWPTRCTFSFVCDIYSDSIYCHPQPNVQPGEHRCIGQHGAQA